MGSSNIRDVLTAFSPSMDLVAITAGDGRIKIWDTVKGQVQTEFTDMIGSEESEGLLAKRGHLSVDYTCINWFSLQKKKKRKLGDSLLIMGTGSGDVLALDVSVGQLKWRLRDCHPGGVSALSFSKETSSVYTVGVDGMVCNVDISSGNIMGKFKASAKAISSMAVSPDGEIIATASGQLKTFGSSDHKTMQKFTGHPANVRCLIFSDDKKYILSSAIGERFVAIWSLEGSSKKKSAICALAMDDPPVFLDCKASGESGLFVLAVSESGVCYFWSGQSVEDLRNAQPTKIAVSSEDEVSDKRASIFSARILGSNQVFVAYGLLAKPTFLKVLVNYGTDVLLGSSNEGILLPATQNLAKSKKGRGVQSGVIALDRSNAEDAVLPIPKVLDSRVKNIERASDSPAETKDEIDEMEVDSESICMEDWLRSLGLLSKPEDDKNSAILDGIDLEVETPQKKIKEFVVSKEPSEAYKLLAVLVAMWQSGSCSGKYVLPWIYSIIVYHNRHVMSEEPANQLLNSLFKVCKSRGSAIQPLLQLSGRLQLVTAQINKAAQPKTVLIKDKEKDESDDEDEDVVFEEDDDESDLSSDNDES